jgi:hypothetical protein
MQYLTIKVYPRGTKQASAVPLDKIREERVRIQYIRDRAELVKILTNEIINSRRIVF